MDEEVAWGRHPVLALLKAGGRRVDEVAVLAEARGPLAEIVAVARRAGVKVSYRTRDQLTAIAGSPSHQGVVARVAAATYVEVDDLLAVPVARGEPACLLALDQVQDPRNLGALLRTADALGVHGVILTKHRATGVTAAAARTAVGAAESVAVARVTNLVDALGRLKNAGLWVYGGMPEGGTPVWTVDLSGPVCLVLGGEGPGLRSVVAGACDALVSVPMAAGRVGSLNVAAAGAVLCYEVMRQRRVKKGT